jgi:hypothetical protein
MEKIVDPKADRKIAESYKGIPGWGIDADPDNNPTYPMKNYTGADHERINYEKPPQQEENIEILKSNERPEISRVFGTSTPLAGVSGMIRRFAFRYSESSYGHWFPLVMADRIDVVQGIINDIKQGIFPNIFVEKGWKAEWKYNRNGLIKKLAVTVLVTTVAIALLSRKKKQSLFS